jgi:hypothetical protein
MIVVGRTRWLAVRAVAATMAGVTAVAACTSNASEPPTQLVPASHKSVVLGRGVVGGKHWALTVSSSGEGNLCMGVNDQLPLRVQQHDDVFAEDGCGFGPPSYFMSGPFDEAIAGGYRLMWGPVPAGAVRVRLDTYRQKAQPSRGHALSDPGCKPSAPARLWVPVTHRLPAWAEPGGWFITHTGVSGCGYSDATFYDSHGHQITEHWW